MWGALRKPYQGETYALGSTVCAGGRRGRFGVPRGDSAHHPLLHAGRQEGQGPCRGCGGPHRRVDRRGSRVEYAGFVGDQFHAQRRCLRAVPHRLDRDHGGVGVQHDRGVGRIRDHQGFAGPAHR